MKMTHVFKLAEPKKLRGTDGKIYEFSPGDTTDNEAVLARHSRYFDEVPVKTAAEEQKAVENVENDVSGTSEDSAVETMKSDESSSDAAENTSEAAAPEADKKTRRSGRRKSK